ncbi:hypothetical protein BYT27DRAFT_7333531 [Phlegmacium glaucopus]|nr:hypothetical protein BYT27DRAFT_7333531 [Phlegmacium glaucopus]
MPLAFSCKSTKGQVTSEPLWSATYVVITSFQRQGDVIPFVTVIVMISLSLLIADPYAWCFSKAQIRIPFVTSSNVDVVVIDNIYIDVSNSTAVIQSLESTFSFPDEVFECPM